MNTIQFHPHDAHHSTMLDTIRDERENALTFAFLQLLHEHGLHNGIIFDNWFRVGLRSAWKVSPFGVPGRRLFETHLGRALQRGHLAMADDGMIHLTEAGIQWVETALTSRLFAGVQELRAQYRASLWPPPEGPADMAMAA